MVFDIRIIQRMVGQFMDVRRAYAQNGILTHWMGQSQSGSHTQSLAVTGQPEPECILTQEARQTELLFGQSCFTGRSADTHVGHQLFSGKNVGRPYPCIRKAAQLDAVILRAAG